MPFYIKSLFKCILYLGIALAIAGLFIGLIILYYENFPSYSSEGAAWGGVGDGLSIAVSSFFFASVAILWWTLYVARIMIRHRSEGNILLSHGAMLLMAYFLVYCYILKFHWM